MTNFDGLPVPPCDVDTLKEEYIFAYSDETTMGDLCNFLALNMFPYDYGFSKDHMWFDFIVCNENWSVQEDYKLCDFVKNNNLDKLNVFSTYGTGACGYFKEIYASIYINPNEGKHKYIPHVHVYRGTSKVGDCARISLRDMTYMEGSKLDDLFTKKVANIIFEILEKYQNELIEYYEKVQHGMLPKPIYMDLDDKIICFH